jgi:hypothetical protein
VKITITNTTTGQMYPICSGGANSPLDDLNLSHTSSVQEVEFPRAREIKLFDRGNARFDQTFSALYARSSVGSAESWLFEMRNRIPRFGRVQFTSESNVGNAQAWYLHNGSCQIISARHIGSAVLATFRIRGGELTTLPAPA